MSIASAETDPFLGRGSTLEGPVTTPDRPGRATLADLGLLVARVVLGGLAVLQGTATLVGIPRGSSRAVTETVLAARGFVRPDLLTTVLGWVLLAGGVLVVGGAFTSFAGAALLALAVTVLGLVAPSAWTAQTPVMAAGPLFGLALAALVVLAGPGRVAMSRTDRARRPDPTGRRARWRAAARTVCLLAGVAGGVVVLIVLR